MCHKIYPLRRVTCWFLADSTVFGAISIAQLLFGEWMIQKWFKSGPALCVRLQPECLLKKLIQTSKPQPLPIHDRVLLHRKTNPSSGTKLLAAELAFLTSLKILFLFKEADTAKLFLYYIITAMNKKKISITFLFMFMMKLQSCAKKSPPPHK